MIWINVKEKMPENESTILCIDKNNRMFVAKYSRRQVNYIPGYVDDWDSDHCCGREPDSTTHWMPLPEAPNE